MSAELRRALGFTVTLVGDQFRVMRFGKFVAYTQHGDETDALIRATCGAGELGRAEWQTAKPVPL